MAIFFSFAGGVALFLLGMKLLTDGLKLAAGETLRILLAKYTSTPFKGVLSGILITAMVQSSSAVIFATIGFVNAGMLTLLQAAYVIFGSNVGTTLTGWIIATVGFQVDLQLLSMPLLAVGMGLWLGKGNSRLGALGHALVGFSIFFLGIDILKSTFENLGEQVPLDDIGTGFSGMIVMFLLGILLTTVMQSSSAAIAVVITAAAGGVVPVSAAAVLVVGADIGTTSTALLAVIGATPNAKRAAMVHVLFNVLKGPLALPFIGFYLSLIYAVFGSDLSVAVTVALFHTFIKVLGLLVLLPFTNMLVTFLQSRFTANEQEPQKARFLDDNLLFTPSMAVSALIFELKRVGRKSRTLSLESLEEEKKLPELKIDMQTVDSLNETVVDYIGKMHRTDFPPDLEYVLPQALRITQYFSEARQHSVDAFAIEHVGVKLPKDIKETLRILKELMHSFMILADSERDDFSVLELNKLVVQLESSYETAKMTILKSGSSGIIPLKEMMNLHDIIRNYRRVWDQYMKAAVYMDDFNKLIEREPGTGAELEEPVLSDETDSLTTDG